MVVKEKNQLDLNPFDVGEKLTRHLVSIVCKRPLVALLQTIISFFRSWARVLPGFLNCLCCIEKCTNSLENVAIKGVLIRFCCLRFLSMAPKRKVRILTFQSKLDSNVSKLCPTSTPTPTDGSTVTDDRRIETRASRRCGGPRKQLGRSVQRFCQQSRRRLTLSLHMPMVVLNCRSNNYLVLDLVVNNAP